MKLIKEIEKSMALKTLLKCNMRNIRNALFEICDNAHALPFDFDAKLQGVVDENDASPLVVDIENSLLIWGSIEIDIESPDVRLFVFIDEDDKKFMHIYTGIHGSRVNMNGVPFRPSIRHLDFAITDDVYEALASESTHDHESSIDNKDEVNVQHWLLLMDLMFPSGCSQNQVKDIMCEALYNLYKYKVDNKDITVVPVHLLPTGDRCFTIRIEMKTDNICTVDPEKIKRDFNDHYCGVRMITVVMKNVPHEVRGQYQISIKERSNEKNE